MKVVAEREAVRGCELVEVVRGENVDHIRKQAARKGDTALITGQAGVDLPFILVGPFGKGIKTTAEVYQCEPKEEKN